MLASSNSHGPMSAEPRKIPQQQRSAVTVAAILEATARILETEGPDALTTNAAAERAGVSIGSLYQYFPNKTALLVELVRSERRSLLERLERIPEWPAQDLQALVRALVEAAVAHQLTRPALARALDFLEPGLPLDAETAALTRNIAMLVARLLGAHGVANPHVAARDLVALTKGMVDAAGLAGETDPAPVTDRILRAASGYLG